MLTASRRRLLRFTFVAVPLFVLLAWPFPFVGRGCRFLVRAAVNGWVFDPTLTPSAARLVPRPGSDWYLINEVGDPKTNTVESQFDVDVYQAFYLPIIGFGALTLAGKCTWGGRQVIAKLLIGILVLGLRGSLRFIALERALAGVPYGSVDLLLLITNRSLVAPLGMAFAMPLLLWFGLFRRSLIGSDNPRPGQARR